MAIRNLSGETVDGIVGIGTTNLGTEARLHVGKSAATGGEGGQMILQKSHNGSLAAHLDNFNSTNDYLRILKGGDTTSSAVVSVFDLTNIRLGIGVYPEKALDVSGNARLQGGDRKLIFNNGSVETSLDQMAGAVGGLGTLGRFGVGTVAPNNNLQVVGNITFGTGATNEAVRNMMTGGTMVFQATDANHRIIIRGKQDVAGAITGNSNEMDFYEFGEMNFYTGVNTGTSSRVHALKLATNGNATFAGNVGVGITPVEVLDLQTSSGDCRVRLDAPASSDTEIKFFNAGVAQYTIGHDDATDNFVIGGANVDAPMVSVDKSGKVGIGTASPQSPLQVNANIYSSIRLGSDYNYSQNREWRFITNNFGSASWGGIALQQSTAQQGNTFATKFGIDINGNVGIGTTSPAAKLHINGTGDAIRVTSTNTGVGGAQMDLLHFSSSPADNDVMGFINMGGYYSGTSSAYFSSIRTVASDIDARQGEIQFWTVDTTLQQRMVLDKSGNVGIGYTSPGSKLSVNGDGGFVSNSSSRVLYLTQQSADNGNIIQFLDQSGNNVWELVGRNNQFYIYNNALSQHSLYIVPSNNYVGIGTTNPGAKLTVVSNGTQAKFDSTASYSDILFSNTSGTGGFLNFGGTTSFNVYVGGGAGSNLEMSLTNTGTLTVAGDVVAFGSPSDKRLKENIKPIKTALDKVTKLQGVSFDWKDKHDALDREGNPVRLKKWKNDLGFIAQDVQKVVPELVRENENGMLSVRHQSITPILLEAIKELKAEIDELKKQIK